jgi:hypothetical protein
MPCTRRLKKGGKGCCYRSKGKKTISTGEGCRHTYGAALSRRRSTMRQMCAVSTARQAVSESRTMA